MTNMEREDERVFETMMADKLEDIAEFIISRANEILAMNGNWDTGFLARSGHIAKKEKDVITIEWSAPYAWYVEYGRNPGKQPPYDVIHQWVIRKLGFSGKKADSVSWAICAWIGKHGTEPHPFLRAAVAEAREKFNP